MRIRGPALARDALHAVRAPDGAGADGREEGQIERHLAVRMPSTAEAVRAGRGAVRMTPAPETVRSDVVCCRSSENQEQKQSQGDRRDSHFEPPCLVEKVFAFGVIRYGRWNDGKNGEAQKPNFSLSSAVRVGFRFDG